MSEAECWARIEQHEIGRLAVSVMHRPDVFPVNYRVDGRALVVKTAPGLKLAAAALGRGVAFEVDDFDRSSRTGWSVVIHGRATEIEELDELLAAEDLGVEPWAGGPKGRYLRITPTSVSGRIL
ncbi:MAG: pyridoxamine 5'-phosphate oxidase family protein [Actinomycetota bacterium]